MSIASVPTVAFVDDEPFVLEGLRRLLRAHRERWQMLFYNSAAAFWSDRTGNWPDVAVLDLNMPGGSGLDLAKALRAEGAGTRCIMLTGNAGVTDAIAFINEAAVFRFYMKPCGPEDLAAAVDAALAERERDRAMQDVTASGPSDAITDRLAIGTVLIDNEFRVVFANKSAMRLLREGSSVATDSSNRLRASSVSGTQRLACAVRQSAATGLSVAISLESAVDGRVLHVTVCAGGNDEGAGATLFLNDPGRLSYPDAARLRSLFGLTGSESRIVECLVRGQTLEEAAQANGLKIASARTYLKSVFLKMGVTRQAELVQKAFAASMAIVLAVGN